MLFWMCIRTAVKRATTKPLRSGRQTVGLLPLWGSDGRCPCSAISSVEQFPVRRKRDVPNMGTFDSKSFWRHYFVCTIVAVFGAKFSSEDHRTHAETTASADETRSSFDTSTLPPQGTGVTSFELFRFWSTNAWNSDIFTGAVVLN